MSGSSSVLVISRDAILLESRRLILDPFFEVEGADSVDQATSLLESRAFDLVVLCHSLSEVECIRAVKIAGLRYPHSKFLTLIPAHGRSAREFSDKEVGIDSNPYTLLKKSAEILGLELKVIPRQLRS